ncbi:MAG: hypothetical protein ABW046_15880 [Actinoplanes sp.]
MTRLRGTLIAAAVPLFLLSACAQPGNVADAASPTAPAPAAGDLVLRADSFGGFVPPEQVVGAIPSVSVYGDGRVITEGPVPAIYPGPALPNLQVQQITPELVRQLVQEGQTAGVRTGADFGRPNVADAPSTRVTVLTGNGPQSVTVEALNEGRPDDPMLTPDQQTARTKLAAYVKKLQDLPTAEGMPHPKPYEAQQVAVLARPWSKPGNDLPRPDTKAWPGPALPGPVLNQNIGIGCVLVSGAEQATVLTAAAKANALTSWTQGGQKWAITFRPLLPDEKNGCAVVKGAK